ncbi:MAG: hypothetical protein ACI81P_002043 [Neolewinella sp.]|jgi:hypothetical protein
MVYFKDNTMKATAAASLSKATSDDRSRQARNAPEDTRVTQAPAGTIRLIQPFLASNRSLYLRPRPEKERGEKERKVKGEERIEPALIPLLPYPFTPLPLSALPPQ